MGRRAACNAALFCYKIQNLIGLQTFDNHCILNQACRGYEMSHPHPYPYPQMPLSIASDGNLALDYCVRYQVFVHVRMYVCPSTFHCCNGLDDCEAQHQHRQLIIQ